MKHFESFGDCLKRCLKENHLSASEAAKLVGFRSRNSMFRILAGETGDEVKLRFLENHDRPRAAQIIGDENALRCWMAFQYFQKGMPLIYNGQEVGAVHLPSLFDKDTICWNTGKDYAPLLKTLRKIKDEPIVREGSYSVTALPNDVLLAVYEYHGEKLVGIFPVGGMGLLVSPGVGDGQYCNLLDDTIVEVHFGMTSCNGPIIFRA
jgi:hypothetical protein